MPVVLWREDWDWLMQQIAGINRDVAAIRKSQARDELRDIKRETKIMAIQDSIDAMNAAVTAQTSVVGSVQTLAALDSLSAAIQQNTVNLANAVSANTPVT